MRSVETTAKTRQEAIKKALEELGAELHEVQIEILDEGSRGIFGLGARNVRVKLTLEKDVPTRRHVERERPERTERTERTRGEGRERGRGGERRERRTEQQQPRTDQPRTAQPRADRQGGERETRPPRPERQERGPKPERAAQDRGQRQQQQPRQPRQERAERTERPDRERQERQPRPQRPQRPRPEPRPRQEEAKVNEEVLSAPVETEAVVTAQEPAVSVRREPERDLTPVTDARREEAAALLAELVAKMGIEAQVTSSLTEDGRARLNIESADSAILIGRKGRNLQALQYLINRMMRPGESDTSERFVIDVESYLDRRRESLEEMAKHLAERAKESGRDVRVKPLSPQERRIIHLALQDDPDVRTFSLGTSSIRTVVISPKNATRDASRPRRSRGGSGRRNGRAAEAPREDTEPAVVQVEEDFLESGEADYGDTEES